MKAIVGCGNLTRSPIIGNHVYMLYLHAGQRKFSHFLVFLVSEKRFGSKFLQVKGHVSNKAEAYQHILRCSRVRCAR